MDNLAFHKKRGLKPAADSKGALSHRPGPNLEPAADSRGGPLASARANLEPGSNTTLARKKRRPERERHHIVLRGDRPVKKGSSRKRGRERERERVKQVNTVVALR